MGWFDQILEYGDCFKASWCGEYEKIGRWNIQVQIGRFNQARRDFTEVD